MQAYRDAAPAARTGGTLSVDVVAYGTRAWKANKVRPFVAVRTRLADASTGQVMYDSTSDVRGEGRDLTKWSGDATEFRRELETLARTLGTRSADRALTPRK